MCPRKISSPIPPKPVEPPLEWPPTLWDSRFKDMIQGFGDILAEEFSHKEAIFTAEEPTRLKPDAKKYLAKRSRRSPLHCMEHIRRALKHMVCEGMIEKAPPGTVFSFISLGY